MWQVKRFGSQAAMEAWIEENKGRVQYERLFVNNGYAVEYRRLRILG